MLSHGLTKLTNAIFASNRYCKKSGLLDTKSAILRIDEVQTEDIIPVDNNGIAFNRMTLGLKGNGNANEVQLDVLWEKGKSN